MSKVVKLIWVMSSEVVVHTDDEDKAEGVAYDAMLTGLEKADEENPRMTYVEDSLRVVDVFELQ